MAAFPKLASSYLCVKVQSLSTCVSLAQEGTIIMFPTVTLPSGPSAPINSGRLNGYDHSGTSSNRIGFLRTPRAYARESGTNQEAATQRLRIEFGAARPIRDRNYKRTI